MKQVQSFTLLELESIRDRCELVAEHFANGHASGSLIGAVNRLGDAADMLHAVFLRESAGARERPDQPELVLPADLPTASAADGMFKVRPKSKRRLCSVCGQPQWYQAPHGWTCRSGHGGAEPLAPGQKPEVDQDQVPDDL